MAPLVIHLIHHVEAASGTQAALDPEQVERKGNIVPILPYRGHVPQIAADAFIAPNATIIGDVTIGAGASIWFGAVLRGDVAPIRIGPGTNIQDNCVLHADEDTPCEIGADCTIGHSAVIHGAQLADRVLVGMHATVLNGARVGSECMLAAGTLVPEGKQIEPGQLVMGLPGKAVRRVTPAERERILDGASGYRERARIYRAELANQMRGE